MRKIYIPIAVLNVILPIILINKSYIVTNISYKNTILLFAITLLIFEVINYIIEKNKKVFLFLLTIFIISIIYIAIYKYSYFISLANNLVNLAIKINNLTITASPVDFLLIYPFYILIIPTLTFFYLILFKLNLGISVTLINTLILVIYDLLNFSTAVKTVLFLYIFLVFMNYSLCKLSIKVKKNYSKALIIYYLIICISFSGIIYWFMPSKYGKEADAVQYKFDNIINNQQQEVFNFDTIGINTSRTSTLGKKLQMNNDKLSLVSGDVPNYLRTKVYYNYNYDRWIENRRLPLIRAKETLNVSDLVTGDELVKRNIEYNQEKGAKIKTISVQNLNDNFYNVMISPDSIAKVVSSKNSDISMYDNENYLVGLYQSKYTINFYDYSDTEIFENYSKSKYKDDINNLYNSINKSNTNTSYGVINNALNFTSSQRVKDLAYKITSTASNNTEKLKLIQDYLLNNYSYSLQPNAMSNNSRDYADFFLFDEKKGYCTSFATAAVMLCRAVGIPARYVEGFKVSGEKDDKGRYVLRSSDAHGWAEVLTSVDKGTWTILESTPGYQSSSSNSTENTTTKNNTQNSNQQKQSVNPGNNNKVNTPPAAKEKSTAKAEQNNIDKKINIDINKILQNYNYIIIVVCIIILYIIIRFLRRKYILKKITNNESLIPLYTFVLKRLKTIKITKQPYETDKEFAIRIKNKLNIEPLVEAIYKETYGNEKTALNKNSIILAVEKTVKSNSNVLKYYMFF